VCFTLRPGAKAPYTLYDLSDQLARRGWQVPAFPLSGEAADITVMRIMIRQGVSRDMAALLLEDFRRAIAHFDEHPITVPLAHHEVAMHDHT
jgi:glutamate decarboxylase